MRQRLQARIDMLMENIALRHQLMVYERGRTARRSLSGNDRLLWCFLAPWGAKLHPTNPDGVLCSHNLFGPELPTERPRR